MPKRNKLDLFDHIVKLSGRAPSKVNAKQKTLIGIAGVLILMGVLLLEFYWLRIIPDIIRLEGWGLQFFLYLFRVTIYNLIMYKFYTIIIQRRRKKRG